MGADQIRFRQSLLATLEIGVDHPQIPHLYRSLAIAYGALATFLSAWCNATDESGKAACRLSALYRPVTGPGPTMIASVDKAAESSLPSLPAHC